MEFVLEALHQNNLISREIHDSVIQYSDLFFQDDEWNGRNLGEIRLFKSRWRIYARLKQLKDLLAIFNYLLIRMSGDVEETLRLMERLQKEGILDPNYDLERLKTISKIKSW